ncbi:MAG: hypothetical protein EPO28_04835 [Saprospiraceae bacterium]|nr:MAG: hypothetical protein EPO28_04835 [Saprospiraceae bacterium]
MKKYVTTNLAIVFFIAVCISIFSSCKKESENIPETPSTESNSENASETMDASITTRSLGLSVDVSLQDGRLIFDSEADFENGMVELKELNTLDWNNSINFNSFWEQFNTLHTQAEMDEMDELPIMDDEALLAVLNPNGIVQVNPWIFKLNGANRIVYVLPVSKINKINILNNEVPVDPDILTFSFDDDVFYILETGENPQLGCQGENCAARGEQGEDSFHEYCSRDIGDKTVKYERKGKVKYDSGGIWKVFKMKFKHNCKSGGGSDKTTFGFVYEYFYRKKCSGETGTGVRTEGMIVDEITGQLLYNVWYDNKKVLEFYKGTRCLSDYYARNPINPEDPVEVLHLDQCLIDGGGYDYLVYDVGNIAGG